MNRKSLSLAALLLLASTAAQAAPPNCVRFEPPFPFNPATVFGAPAGHSNGDLAFVSSGISGYVWKFLWASSGTAFNLARVELPPVPFASGQSLRINNINVDFRFPALLPQTVQIAFLDLGGYENLKVNGSSIYVGELTAAPATLGGATVSVAWTPLPPPTSGKRGVLTVQGKAIQDVWIGGQELWIDDVCSF